jgi:signal transduction histidine kinase
MQTLDKLPAEDTATTGPRLTLPMRFAAGVLGAGLLALGAFYLLMRPPAGDIRDMALFLSATAALSIIAGYSAYRLGWISRAPRIMWTLLGGYALASILTFLNVWITARLMFINRHDLLLATVLLLFAGGIAMSLGYFFSAALRDDIAVLDRASQDIAHEHLDTRVPVTGRNEIAGLGRSFNSMAAQLQATASQQRELEALRRNLIAWVGHDLRTPLASVRAIIEALADRVVEDPVTVERYLATARRDIRSLSLLIDDLFEMAQLDAGGLPLDRAPNSIADLISDTIESFSALAAAQDVRLTGHAGPGVDPVMLDAQKIGRVLANLVDNALRYSEPGGSVQIEAEVVPGGVRVSVADTGAGIPPVDLEHVFEQFYRGEKSRSRATGGAGLGLAIARGIIEAHGGTIGVESQPRIGTRFFFILPLVPA